MRVFQRSLWTETFEWIIQQWMMDIALFLVARRWNFIRTLGSVSTMQCFAHNCIKVQNVAFFFVQALLTIATVKRRDLETRQKADCMRAQVANTLAIQTFNTRTRALCKEDSFQHSIPFTDSRLILEKPLNNSVHIQFCSLCICYSYRNYKHQRCIIRSKFAASTNSNIAHKRTSKWPPIVRNVHNTSRISA